MHFTFKKSWALATVACAALAACGGGGGSESAAQPQSSITVLGTAAKGAALAGATIDVKCAAGTATGTTQANGQFSITLNNGALPCALRATGVEGSVFHGVAPGAGNSGTHVANLTPLSELAVAKLSGSTPSAYFNQFASTTAVDANTVAQALGYVRTALAGVADLQSANPLTDSLVVGDTLDQKIDALMARLTRNSLTIAQLNAAVLANPDTPSVLAFALAPAATTCAWLKSGKFRLLHPYDTNAATREQLVDIDAAALSAKYADGSSVNFSHVSGCQYQVDTAAFTTTVLVSQGGALLMNSQSKTDASFRTMSIGLPEQGLSQSALTGEWQWARWSTGFENGAIRYSADMAEIRFDAAGNVIADANCDGLAPCNINTISTPPQGKLVAGANGGFDAYSGAQLVGRGLLFRSLQGSSMSVFLSIDGYFMVGKQKAAQPESLPTVGAVDNIHELSLQGNGTVATVGDNSLTVLSADATTQTVTRRRGFDQRVDTFSFNQPRQGLHYRAANACTKPGQTATCAEVVGMTLPGMGISLLTTVGALNTNATFMYFAVRKPN